MGSFSTFNCGVKHLLCAIDVFTKYVWVKPLKDKKGKTVLHGFIVIVKESKTQRNKLWIVQRKEF